MKVLIVENDDDLANVMILSLGLDRSVELMGIACDVEEAIVSAADQPDVIVLDNFLDDSVTGIALAGQLKKISPTSKILLFSDFDLKFEARESSVIDGFLPKAQVAELLATVRNLAIN